jgi:hypothetical protein
MDLKFFWSFTVNNWGNLATVIGLGISIWTLVVARGAKKAAQQARNEARRQKLTEELQSAVHKIEQLGHYILSKKWEIAFLQAQEVASSCSLVLRRWSDTLNESSRDRILMAQAQAGSVAKAAMKASDIAPTDVQIRRIAAAQQLAFQLLSGEKGESLGLIERSG